MSTTPRYIAELSNVSEVSLVGTADLAFWKAHMSDGALTIAESEGKARLLVSASAAKFMGLPFGNSASASWSCRRSIAVGRTPLT
jgi:hypothetical protein